MIPTTLDHLDDLPADQILDPDGRTYIERYHLAQTNDLNARIHHWLGSDHQRSHHDHPWPNVTTVLAGRLLEHTPDGDHLLEPGTVVVRAATDAHAIELLTDDAWTLFATGPLVRQWGFHTPRGWVHWRAYPHAGCYAALAGHPDPRAHQHWGRTT